MRASVVICTHDPARYDSFVECVESVREQTYDDLEIVLVIDGDQTLSERVDADFGNDPRVTLVRNEQNRGISYSRTRGAKLASGDLVAFIDDDGVARPDWLAQLVETAELEDALAVAGPVEPRWVNGRPWFFPDEFLWLVGCTEPGFASDGEEIRNGYGSNLAFRREAFLAVGGYDENTGRKGDTQIQAHEPPVCVRLSDQFGERVIFTDSAVVDHTLFEYRSDFRWLVNRAFRQGYSKRLMDLVIPDSMGREGDFLSELLFERVPARSRRIGAGISQLIMLGVFTALVGVGYLWGILQIRSHEDLRTGENDSGEDVSTQETATGTPGETVALE